jgi:hypothetical protein
MHAYARAARLDCVEPRAASRARIQVIHRAIRPVELFIEITV